MPNNNPTANLFALVDDDDAPIRRIPLTAALNAELAQLFAEQPIEFTGSYNVDEGEIFTIADYPLPPAIAVAKSVIEKGCIDTSLNSPLRSAKSQ